MKAKNSILALTTILLLTACSTPTEEIEEVTQAPENFDPNAMTGMPCHQMGDQWMGDCEFDEEGNLIVKDAQVEIDLGDSFSQDIKGLPEAKPSEIILLKDGDTYEMEASLVKQELGNKEIKRLAYNGQIPGPLLKVEQNAEITLFFKNSLDVDTTLHSHGLRLDNQFDGVPEVTQDPIKPGETFSYTIKFPDEGIYWYHPHIREDYTQELGLYGNMLVEPEDPDYWAKVDREEVLIFDDILITEDQPVFNTDHTTHSLMGRFGNTMLINNEEDFQMTVKQNETIRFYLTNVANTRTFDLSIPGVQMKLVGSDVGRVENETLIDSTIIAPAERMIVEMQFPEKGTFEIIHKIPEKAYVMGQITVEGELETVSDFETLRSNPTDYESVRSNMQTYLDQDPDKSLRLSIDMPSMEMGAMAMSHNPPEIEWEDDMPQMNATSTSENVTWKLIDEETKKENMDINWEFDQGDMVKIRIFNDPESMHPMQHPIHFHGQRFVVLSRDGVANDNLQWKDTSLIKNGEAVDILVEMSNPGTWMAHCHIAEHLHSGMMMGFEVL